MKKEDGGQAFPRAGYEGPEWRADAVAGMSLRDWFAGMALTGIAHSAVAQNVVIDPETVSRHAYAIADALLEERERHED